MDTQFLQNIIKTSWLFRFTIINRIPRMWMFINFSKFCQEYLQHEPLLTFFSHLWFVIYLSRKKLWTQNRTNSLTAKTATVAVRSKSARARACVCVCVWQRELHKIGNSSPCMKFWLTRCLKPHSQGRGHRPALWLARTLWSTASVWPRYERNLLCASVPYMCTDGILLESAVFSIVWCSLPRCCFTLYKEWYHKKFYSLQICYRT
jgi:branched-subunit amino acid transport protein